MVVISTVLATFGLEWAIHWLHPITTAYRWDAATDYRLKPDLDITFATNEFRTRIQTNGHGLRDVAWSATESRPVILVLGDSFAFGHGVEGSESFPSRLQSALKSEARVVNAGHPGWDTRRELAFLAGEGRQFAPRLVIAGIVLNDFLANSGGFRFAPTATGPLRYLPFPAIATTLEYLTTDPRFVLFRLGFDVTYGAVDHMDCLRPSRCSEGWRATGQLLTELAAETRRQGAELLVVHLPTHPEVAQLADLAPYEPALARTRLATLAAERGVAFLDLAATVPFGDGHFIPRDGHWTARGHQSAADGTLSSVRRLLGEARKPTP
jgi:hypothetical protein